MSNQPTECECDPRGDGELCEFAADWPYCDTTNHGCPYDIRAYVPANERYGEMGNAKKDNSCCWAKCFWSRGPNGNSFCTRPEPFEHVECFIERGVTSKEHAEFEAWVRKALDAFDKKLETLFEENRDYWEWHKSIGNWQNEVEAKIEKLQHNHEATREPNYDLVHVYGVHNRPFDKDHPEAIYEAYTYQMGDGINTRKQTIVPMEGLWKGTIRLIIFHDELPEAER